MIAIAVQEIFLFSCFETILEKIVAKYEGNVGIRTYNPDVIAADPNGDFWLYNKKKDEKQKHSYFHRYRQFLIKEKFDPKVIFIYVTKSQISQKPIPKLLK